MSYVFLFSKSVYQIHFKYAHPCLESKIEGENGTAILTHIEANYRNY